MVIESLNIQSLNIGELLVVDLIKNGRSQIRGAQHH